jgi:hypothetical protein
LDDFALGEGDAVALGEADVAADGASEAAAGPPEGLLSLLTQLALAADVPFPGPMKCQAR